MECKYLSIYISMTKCRRPRTCFRYFALLNAFKKHSEADCFRYLEADCFRYLEADCFRYFALLSLLGSIWKLTVFAILDCFDTEKTKQRKHQASKTVSWSPALCHSINRYQIILFERLF